MFCATVVMQKRDEVHQIPVVVIVIALSGHMCLPRLSAMFYGSQPNDKCRSCNVDVTSRTLYNKTHN